MKENLFLFFWWASLLALVLTVVFIFRETRRVNKFFFIFFFSAFVFLSVNPTETYKRGRTVYSEAARAVSDCWKRDFCKGSAKEVVTTTLSYPLSLINDSWQKAKEG